MAGWAVLVSGGDVREWRHVQKCCHAGQHAGMVARQIVGFHEQQLLRREQFAGACHLRAVIAALDIAENAPFIGQFGQFCHTIAPLADG